MANPTLPIPEELTITLKKPITMSGADGDKVYSEITLREPNVNQLSLFVKRVQKDTAVDAMKFLISVVSNVPTPVLDRVGVQDFFEAMTYMTRWVSPPDEDDPEGNVVGFQPTGS